ncbi:hypothetical protein QBC33DRAFT_525047 [Phialemonium atrogriseum]|uniref:Smr domain-containing protein n=1 Tax=Phialemonium atrogriseum TaxID=1093897 RepID=A0AAJ0C8F2_9PEZI|nr:uncharacterized protein QBC33DRAFT_525047 [Phialemonium atrogriseum]KAK1771865.1 hypothetical protein QBC33DRAFT_525047 [Phialemonium atrogriseum]
MGDLIDTGDGEDNVENVMQRLIDEFSASLDTSLIHAIASDHDIPTSYNQIRNLLLPLAENALIEEATGFDPSGLASLSDLASLRFDDTTDDTIPVSQSSGTEVTTSNSDHSDVLEALRFTDETDLSEDEKIAGLRTIFSNFQDHTIRFVLKQAGGDIERAFDELLNRQYLDENGELAKGVDGFYLPGEETRRKKAGERVTQQKSRPAKLQVEYSVTPHLQDVDELEGAQGFVKLRPRPGAQSSKSVVQRTVAKPSLPLPPLVQRPDGYTSQQGRKANGPMPATTGWQVVAKKQRAITPATAAPVDPALAETVPRSNAQTAATLRRKGASNPLYRQAAGVYAERIREDRRAAQEAASVSYNQLVDSQSTPLKIDLHGVPVIDGVRIAKNRVRRWWEALNEEDRERKATAYGFTVVTGVGHHCSGGVSRLRQAVGTALKNDGWKMQVFTGEFFVTGRT